MDKEYEPIELVGVAIVLTVLVWVALMALGAMFLATKAMLSLLF